MVPLAEAHTKKAHASHNLEAGRAFVAAYVEYVHYAEGLHQSIERAGAHHPEGVKTSPTEDGHQETPSEHKH
jgi:hypothetical protein